MGDRKGLAEKKILIILRANSFWIIVVAVLVTAIFSKRYQLFIPGQTTIITSATLTKAIDISELSTAEYTYF